MVSSRQQKTAIVSSADRNYFPLLVEWVASLQKFESLSDKDICILDAGLESGQCEVLKNMGCIITKPEWPCHIAQWKIRGRNYLKSCVCRPFIPKIFPGYGLYIWMDCDTWLQTDEAIGLLSKAAQKGALAICPQIDRNMQKTMRIEWFGPFVKKVRSFYYSNAKRAFSNKIAKELCARPLLNAGIFALCADAPHWQAWQETIVKALKKGRVFTAEQLSLGFLIYIKGYRAEFLPSWCNWLCEIKPYWDEQRGFFVEPSLPHHPISVLHLCGFDEMRRDRSISEEIKTTDEQVKTVTLRYPDFDGEKCNETIRKVS